MEGLYETGPEGIGPRAPQYCPRPVTSGVHGILWASVALVCSSLLACFLWWGAFLPVCHDMGTVLASTWASGLPCSHAWALVWEPSSWLPQHTCCLAHSMAPVPSLSRALTFLAFVLGQRSQAEGEGVFSPLLTLSFGPAFSAIAAAGSGAPKPCCCVGKALSPIRALPLKGSLI